MLRVLTLCTFFLTSIMMCNSLGIFELRINSTEPQRLFICIGPNCLLGRRYLYLDSTETSAKFNITGGEWQKNFTIDFQLSTKNQNKEEKFTKNWRGSVISGEEFREVLAAPVRVIMKYSCVENIFGPQCKVFCKPSSGLAGHFSCGPNGEKICLTGYTGIHCNKPDCPSGCGNGTCISPGVCRCQFGFKGTSCQECMPNRDCVHGTCFDNFPGTCRCSPGWSGQNCDISIDYCTTFNPCKNGGNCINGKRDSRLDYICECPNGFGGRQCEINSTEHICGSNVCLNGGRCTIHMDKTNCDCPKGFTGSICEINTNSHLCSPNTCKNGGTCLVRGNVAQCACPTCFAGSRCELPVCGTNTTVALGSSHAHPKTAETLVLGLCLIIAIVGTLTLSYCILWQKMKNLILVNKVMGETNQDNSVSSSTIDQTAQYKICPRSSFEAPPPYSSTLEEEFQPKVFKYTTLAAKQTRISKCPQFSGNDGVVV